MKHMEQISKNCSTITKVQPNCNGNTRSGREIKEQKKYLKNIFKIMAKDVPKLIKDIKPQNQESQRTPQRINTKKSIITYIIFKLMKIKANKKILKQTRGEWE